MEVRSPTLFEILFDVGKVQSPTSLPRSSRNNQRRSRKNEGSPELRSVHAKRLMQNVGANGIIQCQTTHDTSRMRQISLYS